MIHGICLKKHWQQAGKTLILKPGYTDCQIFFKLAAEIEDGKFTRNL